MELLLESSSTLQQHARWVGTQTMTKKKKKTHPSSTSRGRGGVFVVVVVVVVVVVLVAEAAAAITLLMSASASSYPTTQGHARFFPIHPSTHPPISSLFPPFISHHPHKIIANSRNLSFVSRRKRKIRKKNSQEIRAHRISCWFVWSATGQSPN